MPLTSLWLSATKIVRQRRGCRDGSAGTVSGRCLWTVDVHFHENVEMGVFFGRNSSKIFV